MILSYSTKMVMGNKSLKSHNFIGEKRSKKGTSEFQEGREKQKLKIGMPPVD